MSLIKTIAIIYLSLWSNIF